MHLPDGASPRQQTHRVKHLFPSSPAPESGPRPAPQAPRAAAPAPPQPPCSIGGPPARHPARGAVPGPRADGRTGSVHSDGEGLLWGTSEAGRLALRALHLDRRAFGMGVRGEGGVGAARTGFGVGHPRVSTKRTWRRRGLATR